MVTIGQLRHRVTLQQPSIAGDGMGGGARTWTDVATVWASVEPLRGSSFWQAQQTQTKTTHVITIRYRPGVTTDYRVAFAGRHFSIDVIQNPSEANRYLLLYCTELTTDA